MTLGICFVIGVCLLLQAVYSVVKYRLTVQTADFSYAMHNPTSNGCSNRQEFGFFFVLVPVLHEEKTLELFLMGMLSQRYPKDRFEVWIITTEKEYLHTNRPNTIDLINDMLQEARFDSINLNVIHYPDDRGVKSDQLNFAFREIGSLYGSNFVSAANFLLLDADSIPDVELISRFNSVLEENINVYQQPLLWFKNIDQLKSPIMQSFAFQQTFFSLSYEMPMFSDRVFPWRLRYCVGHGLCVKGSFLNFIHGFPLVIEDVRIGRMSSFLGFKIKIVPGFGNVETAKSFGVYVKQCSVWFFGCGLFVYDYVKCLDLRGSTMPRPMDLVLLGYGIFKALRWLNKGLLHLLLIIGAIAYSSVGLGVLALVALIMNSCIPVVIVARDFKKMHALNDQLGQFAQSRIIRNAVIYAPFLYVINFVGVYYGLMKAIRYIFSGRIELPKTER